MTVRPVTRRILSSQLYANHFSPVTDTSLGIVDSARFNVKFDSKSDAETPVVPFGLKLSQMGLSLSSPNLRTATSLFSSSDSDEGSANEGSDKSKTSVDHRHQPHDEFTSIDGNEETISGENDVEYAEFSMVHQVPAHVAATTADGSNETPTLNEEMMFLRLFDDLQPQGATAVNDNKNFTAHSKFFRFDVTPHTVPYKHLSFPIQPLGRHINRQLRHRMCWNRCWNHRNGMLFVR